MPAARRLGAFPHPRRRDLLWCSIDVDEYGENPLEIISRAEAAGLPVVPCRSKSAVADFFVFLQAWTAAGDVNTALQGMVAMFEAAGGDGGVSEAEELETGQGRR